MIIKPSVIESVADSSVVINELMAQNDAAVEDAFGEFDDWVELYNSSSVEVNLSGWTLTDDISDPAKYIFPEGTFLAPSSYLVIWADDDEDQGEYHAGFKLSADGESLYLLNTLEESVDEIAFPEAIVDLSYARTPNGNGPFVYKEHTIGDNNDLTSGLVDVARELGVRVYPNPAEDYISIERTHEHTSSASLQIFNVNGQMFYSDTADLTNPHRISLDKFSPGIYNKRVETAGYIIMKKFVKL